eukprot:TRINITY_DN77516_c0_g1_i1.p1 TRINITY_DN77516_c0_g1~~TRINITY_DN77516_c0_g1_i1.p1  ORF type:complete len:380 (-),score=67.95 TRINITY_DN77516_c0_g1_i1:39-1148(-)
MGALDLLGAHYHIGERIGEGYSGAVFACARADDSSSNLLAAKVSGSRKAAAEETRAEAKLLRLLSHCNIVKVHGVFDAGTSVCFVMEKLHRDLLDSLQSYVMREHFDMNGLVHVAQQMASSIEYLHSQAIVHRDVKPENFLVDSEKLTDPDCRIVLADFATACQLRDDQRLTEQVGTTTYWSPELYDKNYSFKVDVWALGVVMHCMASNKFPFEDEEDVRKKAIHLRGVSRECRTLISSLLEKDEDMRPSISSAIRHPWLTGSVGTDSVSTPVSTRSHIGSSFSSEDEHLVSERCWVLSQSLSPKSRSSKRRGVLLKVAAGFFSFGVFAWCQSHGYSHAFAQPSTFVVDAVHSRAPLTTSGCPTCVLTV